MPRPPETSARRAARAAPQPGAADPRHEAAGAATTEIYVWFEDLRARSDGPAAAGMPECLLPVDRSLRLLERRYVAGHLHVLSAARLACRGPVDALIAALYLRALSAGTLAWIRVGRRGRQAWKAIYGSNRALAR